VRVALPTSLAIVRAVIKLSQELGAVTTAEGVETEAQREALRAEHCCQAQGFPFSPALPLHQAASLVEQAVMPPAQALSV
jgi:EAL domain-containing protein (putative c-di-GMP-specific phosphodiesterase class I)